MSVSANSIKSYMLGYYKDFLDESNTLCLTDMVLSAATNFGDNIDYEDIPEIYYEIAAKVNIELSQCGKVNT